MDDKKAPNKLPKGLLVLFWMRRKSIPRVLLLAACRAFVDEQKQTGKGND